MWLILLGVKTLLLAVEDIISADVDQVGYSKVAGLRQIPWPFLVDFTGPVWFTLAPINVRTSRTIDHEPGPEAIDDGKDSGFVADIQIASG
jgi:hypothetical protein